MAVAALIVSIVAVLLAGWGGWSAHQSAPLAGLQVGDQWATSGELGPMAVGDRRLLSYRRSESRDAESTLRLRVVCSKGSETWRVPVELEITPEANVF